MPSDYRLAWQLLHCRRPGMPKAPGHLFNVASSGVYRSRFGLAPSRSTHQLGYHWSQTNFNTPHFHPLFIQYSNTQRSSHRTGDKNLTSVLGVYNARVLLEVTNYGD